MKIGKNIKAIRVSQKIEQKELANRLHISNKTISSWECDRTEPNIGMFEKIAEALNVTKTELLEGRRKSPDTIVITDFKLSAKEDSPTIELTKEEKEIIKLYRLGQYKDAIGKIMEKM